MFSYRSEQTKALLVESSHPRIRFANLWKLLGRRIQFHPVFVGMTGSVTASLMLSQGFYWTRNWILEQPQTDGWFWKKQADWQAETGLSRKEQETARKILRKLNFIQERKEGMPARLSFRLDLDQIAQAVQPDTSGQMNWQDDVAVFALLGQPIVFHRSLASITGSATAALMLSHAVVQTVRILGKRPDGWFWKKQADWQRETGLSRWEQETARKALRELGLLEEKKALESRGDQDSARVLYYRVNLTRLEQLLSKPEIDAQTNTGAEMLEPGKQDCDKPAISNEVTGQTSMPVSSTLKCGNGANSNVGTGQTVMWQTGILESGNRANMLAPKPPSSMPQNLSPIRNIDYNHRLQLQQPTTATEPMDSRRRDWQELIYPRQLDSALHESIGKRLQAFARLRGSPDIAQAMLDVLAHAFQTKGVPNPVGYLNSLIKRDQSHAFDSLPGLPIAKARQEQKRREAARLENEKRMSEEVRSVPPPPVVGPEQGRHKTPAAAAFFSAFQAKRPMITTPTVANSPSDARQASPLVQQKPLSRKSPTPLLSSGSRLVLLGGCHKK